MSVPLTVIVSLTVPTDSVALTTAVWPTDSWMSVCFEFLEALQLRDDAVLAERQQRRAIQPLLVGRRPTRSMPVSTLVIVTVTPGSTPPERVRDRAFDGAVRALRLRERRRRRVSDSDSDSNADNECI